MPGPKHHCQGSFYMSPFQQHRWRHFRIYQTNPSLFTPLWVWTGAHLSRVLEKGHQGSRDRQSLPLQTRGVKGLPAPSSPVSVHPWGQTPCAGPLRSSAGSLWQWGPTLLLSASASLSPQRYLCQEVQCLLIWPWKQCHPWAFSWHWQYILNGLTVSFVLEISPPHLYSASGALHTTVDCWDMGPKPPQPKYLPTAPRVSLHHSFHHRTEVCKVLHTLWSQCLEEATAWGGYRCGQNQLEGGILVSVFVCLFLM